MERKNEVVAQLTSGIEFLLKHKLITYIPERAELFDAHTVISESGKKYTAEHILIATGSTAKRPPIEGCDLPGVFEHGDRAAETTEDRGEFEPDDSGSNDTQFLGNMVDVEHFGRSEYAG